jgi:hypothetical protein
MLAPRQPRRFVARPLADIVLEAPPVRRYHHKLKLERNDS